MKIPHDKLKDLNPGDLITIDGKTGYSGFPMKFRSIIGPFIYVAIDTYKNGKFDYKTHFRMKDFEFYWMEPEGKKEKEIPKSPKLQRSGVIIPNSTKTFREIFDKLNNGCAVVEYQPDDSAEAAITVAQLITNFPTIGITVIKVNSHLYYITNPYHENYAEVG